TVTYTLVYTDSEPGIVFWGADEELSDGGSPRVIVYGYDGLPMQLVAPPSLNYVSGPEHPPSPDYVPGPEHPPSPVEVPYIPEPEYLEYLVPSNAEAPLEDQPLHADASPIALSPGYVADSDLDEDPEEDPEEDEEPFKDEDDDEEEEEYLASADSSVVLVVDSVPSAGDTEAFETDESAPTPRSPQTKARIAEYVAAPAPPLPPPSPLSPWSPLLPQIPSPPLPPPLSLPHLPPPTITIITTTTTTNLTVGQSSTAAPRPTGGHRADYGFIGTTDSEIKHQRAEEVGYGIRDVWVDPTEAIEEVAPTALKGVNARVTELASVQEQDTQDIYAVIEDTQDRQTQTHTQMHDYRIASQESLMTTLIIQNNMPPRRSSATTRADAVAAAAATPITAAAVEQLIKAIVSAALANHETIRNITNGHGDRSYNSKTGIRGTVRTPREYGISVPYQQLFCGEPS
ncbi:hypothetical protein Tco_1353024, partial [Tanacetum coccineum]